MAKRSSKTKAVGRELPAKVAAAQQAPAWAKNDWCRGFGLFLAVVLVYSPVWWAGYIWDDDTVVTANTVIVGPLGLKEIWTTNAADICPLTLTTFWLEHALWGLAPLPYHLVNVLLHGAAAITLWRVLKSLRISGAWLGAALWALHPVQVESVAWIAEMKNTQSGLFFLLSILFYVRSLRAGGVERERGWGLSYVLTLLFAAMAIASKSSTVILPVVLCFCAWWVERKWDWRNLARVMPIFLMAIVAGVVSTWTQNYHGAGDPQWARSWPDRLVTAGDAIWFYLGKMLWPYPLIPVYSRWQIDASQWYSYLPLLAVIFVSFALWLKRDSGVRPLAFAFACYLVAVLPALGFFNMTFFQYTFVSDHFQYLAAMAALALAGALVIRLPYFIAASILLVLGLLSWQQAWVYQNKLTFWTDTLAHNPECLVGHYNLGNVLAENGQLDDGIAHLQKALDGMPNYAPIRSNLGAALAQNGEMDKAIFQFRKAIELGPNDIGAYDNLCLVLLNTGRLDEAVEQGQKALVLSPKDVTAHNNLGSAYLLKGKFDEAQVQFHAALEIAPGYYLAHYNLGLALLKTGRINEAREQFQTTLVLKPDYSPARDSLNRANAMTSQKAILK